MRSFLTGGLLLFGLASVSPMAGLMHAQEPSSTNSRNGSWLGSWFGNNAPTNDPTKATKTQEPSRRGVPNAQLLNPVGSLNSTDRSREFERFLKAYLRRTEVCIRLREIALETADSALAQEADRLEEEARRLCDLQTGRLLGESNSSSEESKMGRKTEQTNQSRTATSKQSSKGAKSNSREENR